MLFGQGGGMGSGGRGRRAHFRTGGGQPFGDFEQPRGQDQHAKIQISLEDAYHGGSKTIQLQIPIQDAYGRVQYKQKTLKVNIPKGVSSGQQLRLSKQGSNGGDLFLDIEITPHPQFKREGNDIYYSLPITPWEAALGAKVTVPTLGGKVDLKIAANSQGGQNLRLKGRGLPGKTPGDQYVTLQIYTPPAKTDAEKKIYEQMAKEMAFNPRS